MPKVENRIVQWFCNVFGCPGLCFDLPGATNFENSRLRKSFGGPGSYLGMETQFTNDLAQFGQTRNARNCFKMWQKWYKLSVRWRKDGPKSVSRWSSEGHSRSHLSNFEGLWRQSFLNCQSRKSNDSITVLLYFQVLRGLVRGYVARSLVYIRLPLDSWGHAVTISATCCPQSYIWELLVCSGTSGTWNTGSPPPAPPLRIPPGRDLGI